MVVVSTAAMLGTVPGIHERTVHLARTWMVGTSPAMTNTEGRGCRCRSGCHGDALRTAIRGDRRFGGYGTKTALSITVMPGLVPGIHERTVHLARTWMAGTGPAMTNTDRSGRKRALAEVRLRETRP